MRAFVKYFVLTIIALSLTAVAWAQAGDGSIAGSVTDSSGGAVPNATIEVSSVGQGFTRTTTSRGGGDYLVPGLPPGTYNITVTANGFQKYQVSGLVLRVAEKARADATLNVGAVSTEVTVAGTNAAPVETESSELSGVVTTKQINQTVLNGRNFTQLVTLVPGVSNQTGQDEGQVGINGNVAYSINGGRTEYNNWELDGGDNMDNGSNSTLNVYPNVDAIAEFRVLTSNYGAQYGRNGSGTIETVTKSGTRDFHGDLFEFLRNEDFNARNFFQETRPSYKKHDYGYTIGGPVFIPKLYNTSKQKTFFFFSEEWRRDRVPGDTFHRQVPSNAQRSGNFSELCPAPGSAVDTTAFPDCPVNPVTGAYFPGNQVPVDPNAQILLGTTIPAATAGSGAQSFFNAAPVLPTNFREELVRVDQNFSDKVRFFYRFTHDSWNTIVPRPLWGNESDFPTVQTNFVGPGVSMVANLAVSASPTLLNETVFSYTTDHILLTAIGNASRPANFTATGLFNNGFGGLLPEVTLANGAPYGGGFTAGTGYFPWNNANPTFTYKDQVTKIAGPHNLYFGAYFVAGQKNEQNSPSLQGVLTFSNSSGVSTGNAFADFLTGRIASFQQNNNKIKYYNRYKILEPYFQDDWHVSKRLTLNLGLRLSLFGTYREKYKQAYNWEPGAYDPAQAPLIDATGDITGQAGALVPGIGNPFTGIVQCGAPGVPRGCLAGHLFNPAPRVGFAFDPVGDGKTAIRGGYGIFFEHTNGNEGNTESLEGSPPLSLSSTQYNIVGYTNIGGGGLLFPLGPNSIPTKAIWPYMQQWHFDVQRDLGQQTVLTVSYVGSKGTHLTDQRDINQIFPTPASANPFRPGQPITQGNCDSFTVNGAPVTGQAAANLNVACGADPNVYRPFPGFGSITGLEDQANSSYNAFQVSGRHYIGHVSMSVAYTWSHSIDDSSDRYDGSFVNSYNLGQSRASSNFDQRHLLTFNYVYDLPFFTHKGFLHTVLGGWQTSGLVTFQTGTPFSVVNGVFGDNAGVGNGIGTGSYVDVIGNPNATPPVREVPDIVGPLLYNPGAFAQPTGLTFGNAGRNIMRNPTRTNWDVGLFKRFPIKSETRAIEFRAEAFNVLNHTQWNGIDNNASCYAGPNNSAGDPSCLGGSTFLHPTAAHNPRIMQLGMKFLF
ncbi:MAG: carboxypeptidase regulatory-like domain-containing protein [Bryobacteraceae bacterium]